MRNNGETCYLRSMFLGFGPVTRTLSLSSSRARIDTSFGEKGPLLSSSNCRAGPPWTTRPPRNRAEGKRRGRGKSTRPQVRVRRGGARKRVGVERRPDAVPPPSMIPGKTWSEQGAGGRERSRAPARPRRRRPRGKRLSSRPPVGPKQT